MENPAIARILLKTTRINRNAAGTSDEKRENVLISRKPPPLAVFVCRGYNDMRQKNQTRRAGDAGDKAARTCRKADAALSAVHREAQARLYRQQWRSHQAWRRQSGGSAQHRLPVYPSAAQALRGTLRSPAGRPRHPADRRKRGTTNARPVHVEENRFPARTRPSLYARAQRQAARRHCKVNEGFCAFLVSFFAALPSGLPSGGGLYNDFPVPSSTGERLNQEFIYRQLIDNPRENRRRIRRSG